MGREDEISIDFYQPVDSAARWFVEPDVYWIRENYDLWIEDQNLAELELAGWGIDFAVGRNFNTTNRMKLSYSYSRGEADVITGNPALVQDSDIEIGELELQYVHDSLNSIWFPTEGMLHKFEYLYASDGLGASSDYQQATVDGAMLLSFGKNTALLNYELGYSFDDEARSPFRIGAGPIARAPHSARLAGLLPSPEQPGGLFGFRRVHARGRKRVELQ
jgi:outer membrane protein assembly factor BamA